MIEFFLHGVKEEGNDGVRRAKQLLALRQTDSPGKLRAPKRPL